MLTKTYIDLDSFRISMRLVFFFKGKTYPDFLGCAICLAMTAVLALGVKGSVRFNTILNVVNFVVWIFIFIAGMVLADFKNWSDRGFAPYGASGVSHTAHCSPDISFQIKKILSLS